MNIEKEPQQNTSQQIPTIHATDPFFRPGGVIPGMQRSFIILKSINVVHHINKRKNKNHTIISRDVEKIFDAIQQLLMLQTLSKIGILEETYYSTIKAIYEKKASIILTGETTEAFSLRSGNLQRCPLKPLAFNIERKSTLLNLVKKKNGRNSKCKIGSQIIPFCS